MDYILNSYDRTTVHSQLEATVNSLLLLEDGQERELEWFLQNAAHLRRAARIYGLPLIVFKRLVLNLHLLAQIPPSKAVRTVKTALALGHAFGYACRQLQDQTEALSELEPTFKTLARNVQKQDILGSVVTSGFCFLAENRCLNESQVRQLVPSSVGNKQRISNSDTRSIFGISGSSHPSTLTRTQSRSRTRFRSTTSNHQSVDSIGVSRGVTGCVASRSQSQEQAREPHDSEDVLGSDQSIWRDDYRESEYLRKQANNVSYKFRTADIRWLQDRFLAYPDWYKRAATGVLTSWALLGFIPYLQALKRMKNPRQVYTETTVNIIQTLEILAGKGRHPHENLIPKLFKCLIPSWDGALEAQSVQAFVSTNKVPLMLADDIRAVRLSALKILLHCRSAGISIMGNDRETREQLIRDYMTDKDTKLRNVATQIIKLEAREEQNYEQTFANCLAQLAAGQANLDTLEAMLISANQWSRAQRLFTSEKLDTINKIQTALSQPSDLYNSQFKAKCAEILYTYLEHPENKDGLSHTEVTLGRTAALLANKDGSELSPDYEASLLNIIDITLQRKRREGLASMTSLVQTVLDIVTQRFISDADSSNKLAPCNHSLALIVICRALGVKPLSIGKPTAMRQEHFKLFRVAVLEAVGETEVESAGSENKNKNHNSLLAFAIICQKCFQQGRQCTEHLLARLLDILNTPWNQKDDCAEIRAKTRLEASKAVYEAIRQNDKLESDRLFILCARIMEREELDQVKCFCSLAYLCALQQQARMSRVSQIDFGILSFIMEQRFDDEKWRKAKDCVLYLLEYFLDTPQPEIMAEALFKCINTFLAEQDGGDEKRIVRLLETYTKQFSLPPDTAQALESISEKPELCNIILQIYNNLTKLGDPIPESAIYHIANMLFEPVREARNALEQLQKIETVQEVPDSVFRLLEMERAREVHITTRFENDKTSALQFIVDSVQNNGSRLTTLILQDVILSRSLFRADKPLLELLCYTVEKGQQLPRQILEDWGVAFESADSEIMQILLDLICVVSQNGDLVPHSVTAAILGKLSSETDFGQPCNQQLVTTYLTLIRSSNSGSSSQTVELEPVLCRMLDENWSEGCVSSLISAVLAFGNDAEDLMTNLATVLIQQSTRNKSLAAVRGLLGFLMGGQIERISGQQLNLLLQVPGSISPEERNSVEFALAFSSLMDFLTRNESVCSEFSAGEKIAVEFLAVMSVRDDAEFCRQVVGRVAEFGPLHWIRARQILESDTHELRHRLVDILIDSYQNEHQNWPECIQRALRRHRRGCGQLDNGTTSFQDEYQFTAVLNSTTVPDADGVQHCIQYLIKTMLVSAKFPGAQLRDFLAKLPRVEEQSEDLKKRIGTLSATVVFVGRSQMCQLLVDALAKCVTQYGNNIDVLVLDAYCSLLKNVGGDNENCGPLNYNIDQVSDELTNLLTGSNRVAIEGDLRFHIMVEILIECSRLRGAEILSPNLVTFLLQCLDSAAALTRAVAFDVLRSHFAQAAIHHSAEVQDALQEFEIWCSAQYVDIKQSVCNNNRLRPLPAPSDKLDLIAAYSRASIVHPLDSLRPDNYEDDLLILDLISSFRLNLGARFHLLQKWNNFKEKSKNPLAILHLLFTNICKYGLTYDKILDIFDVMCVIPETEAVECMLLCGPFYVEGIKSAFWRFELGSENPLALSIIELQHFSFHLLTQVKNFDNLVEVNAEDFARDILQLVMKYNVRESEIPYNEDPAAFLHNLKINIAAKFLHPDASHVLHHNRMGIGLTRLLNNIQDFEQVLELLRAVRANESPLRSKRIIRVIAHIMHQGCGNKIHQLEDQIQDLQDDDPACWVEETDKFVMEHHFGDGPRRVEGEEYFNELAELQTLKDLFGEQNPDRLREELTTAVQKITNGEFKPPNVIPNERTCLIKDMSVPDIKDWVAGMEERRKLCQNTQNEFFTDNLVLEILAVVYQGLALQMNKRLRPIQIVSCLASIKSLQIRTGQESGQSGQKGLLQQIATGCGKSAIIATLAIFHGLFGRQVEIVTSSSTLASRDAKEFNTLYKLFGLEADHNGEVGRYARGRKSCYTSPIVYGESVQFQFDLLRADYSQLGTLGSRGLNSVVLVDEVDSMLIDDSSKIARLASSTAGMSELQPVYHLIWNELQDLLRCCVPLNGRWYLFDGKLDMVNGVVSYTTLKNPGTGETETIQNLQEFVLGADDDLLKATGLQSIQETSFKEFARQHLTEFINKLVAHGEANNEEKLQKLRTPDSLKKLVRLQISKWVDSAMKAVDFSVEKEYVIESGLVKPVDFFSTGQILSSTQWSNALQEMLQLKHGLAMTSETCTTNFMSNIAFFRRYESRIFGFTGTLGSQKAQDVLADVYNVGLLALPNHFQNNYVQLDSVIAASEEEWLNEITTSVMIECQRKRGVLVICADIKAANQIHSRISQAEVRRGGVRSVTKYTKNNANQEREVQAIHPGHAIVATNLAGRGTDISTSNIKQYGGLHVCVTFLPENERVEAQAFGRTARQQNTGTGQLIIQHSGKTMDFIRQVRNEKETEHLDAIQSTQLVQIEAKDALFSHFCNDLQKIREIIKAGEPSGFRSSWDKIFAPSIYEEKYTEAVEAEWAFFMKQVERMSVDDLKNQVLMDARYESFAEPIRAVFNGPVAGKVPREIKTPFPLTGIGNYLLSIDGYLEARVKDAATFFDKAIELDETFSAGALLGKACCLLKGSTNWFGVNSYNFGYKVEAVRLLRKVEVMLLDSITLLYTLVERLPVRDEGEDDDDSHSTNLHKQLLQKVTILGTCLNCVRNAIQVVQRSRRLLHVQWIEPHGPAVEDDKTNQTTTTKYDLDPQNEETLDFLFQIPSQVRLTLIFNDLTVRSSGVDEMKAAVSKGATAVREGLPDTIPAVSQVVKAVPKAAGAVIGAVAANRETDQAIKTLEGFEDEITSETIQLRLKNLTPDQVTSFIRTVRVWERDNRRPGQEQQQNGEQIVIDLEFKGLQWTVVEKLMSSEQGFDPNVKISLDVEGLRDDEAIHALLPQVRMFVLVEDKVKNTSSLKPASDEDVGPARVLYKRLEPHEVLSLLKLCLPNCQFGLVVESLDCRRLQTLVEGCTGLESITLRGLNKSGVERLIPKLRKENINLSLVFQDLNLDTATKLVENSSTEQEHIMLRSLKPISDCFAARERASIENELSDYASLGIELLPEFSESPFIPWFHIWLEIGSKNGHPIRSDRIRNGSDNSGLVSDPLHSDRINFHQNLIRSVPFGSDKL